MTIKEFFESKDRLAIHCNTEEKAKKLLEAFDKAGHCWVTGDRYIEDISWELNEEETCYSNTGCYGSINYLKECRYTILEFEEIELEDASLKSHVEKMDDLISRQDAINAVSEACFELRGVFGRCEEALKALPSAQPEQKKGRWIGKPIAGYSRVRCSVCKDVFLDNAGRWKYCPHCGAKMEEELEI